MHNYKELDVWKKSIELSELAYSVTSKFPEVEKFGLISQIRRSSVSIALNIAEGAGRNSKNEFAQFLGYAYGSSCELDTQFILANRLGFLQNEKNKELESLITQIQKMIFNLKRSLK